MMRPSRATLRWIFRGPDGIRAGWSIALFIVILAVPSVAFRIAIVHYHLMPKGSAPPAFLILAELVNLGLVFAGTAIMARIEKRPVWFYGLASPRPIAHFLAGCAGGVVCLSTLVAILYAGGYLVFDGLAMRGPPIIFYGLVWIFAFILVGFSEEFLFRGYVQSTLTRGIGFWPAALVLSLLFSAAHIPNAGENPLGLFQVVAAGLVFALLLRVSGSLWLAIGVHTTWDWAQSYLYGTPDSGLMVQHHLLISHAAGDPRFSGGSAGPEGSMLAVPILLLGPVILLWICRRAGLFATPNIAALEGSTKEAVLF